MFLTRCERGEPAPPGPAVVREAPDPYVVARDADGREPYPATVGGGTHPRAATVPAPPIFERVHVGRRVAS